MCVLPSRIGIPGDATAAGHPAPSGAGKGAPVTVGATKANNPDEGTDACFLSALCSGMKVERAGITFFPILSLSVYYTDAITCMVGCIEHRMEMKWPCWRPL